MLEKLLTEQPNPASASIDAVSTEEALRIINAEDQQRRRCGRAGNPGNCAGGGRNCSGDREGRAAILHGSGHKRTARRAGRLGVPADLQRPARAGAGDHRGRRSRAQPGHRGHRRRPGDRRPRPARPRLHRARCARRTRGQRAHALCAGRDAEARRLGAVTVGICCTPDSELSRAVDIAIAPLAGPEIIAGSTRMKSGTAQKLVLNMLTTGRSSGWGMSTAT